MDNGRLQSVVNGDYPAYGKARTATINVVLTASPLEFDFRTLGGASLDGQVFNPFGVYVDNTQGNADCVISVPSVSLNIVCKKGVQICVPYPAPPNATVSIVGDGKVTLNFVNYPVHPFTTEVSGGAGGAVAWGDITGFIGNQTDLRDALDILAEKNILQVISMSSVVVSGDELPRVAFEYVDIDTLSQWDAANNQIVCAKSARVIVDCELTHQVNGCAGYGDLVAYRNNASFFEIPLVTHRIAQGYTQRRIISRILDVNAGDTISVSLKVQSGVDVENVLRPLATLSMRAV